MLPENKCAFNGICIGYSTEVFHKMMFFMRQAVNLYFPTRHKIDIKVTSNRHEMQTNLCFIHFRKEHINTNR